MPFPKAPPPRTDLKLNLDAVHALTVTLDHIARSNAADKCAAIQDQLDGILREHTRGVVFTVTMFRLAELAAQFGADMAHEAGHEVTAEEIALATANALTPMIRACWDGLRDRDPRLS